MPSKQLVKTDLRVALHRDKEGKRRVRAEVGDKLAIHASEYLVNFLQQMLRRELGINITDLNYHIEEPEKLDGWYKAQLAKDKLERKRT